MTEPPLGLTDFDCRELTICTGLTCHEAGGHDVLQRLEHLLRENGLESRVRLSRGDCMDACSEGVMAKYGGQRFCRLHPDNLALYFQQQILPCLLFGTPRG